MINNNSQLSQYQNNSIIIQPQLNSFESRIKNFKCNRHNIDYGLLGNNSQCELNCLVCIECLKGTDHGHKFQNINHETISLSHLQNQFKSIYDYNFNPIMNSKNMINAYMNQVTQKIKEELQKQKKRLQNVVEKIMLTEIFKYKKLEDKPEADQKLNICQTLYDQQYQKLLCKDIRKISKQLFLYSPKSLSIGYEKFNTYIKNKTKNINFQVEEIFKNSHYDDLVMKECMNQILYPLFKEFQPQIQPDKRSRVKTQGDFQMDNNISPKKTLRRSLKKVEESPLKLSMPNKSLLDIKQFHVNIRKPIQFKESTLINGKEDNQFMQKLFTKKIKKVKFLYRASENNFSVKKFHQICDNIPNTLTIIQTQFNKIIGGFTPVCWKSTNNTIHTDNNKSSFLFSLSLKQKMPLKDEKSAIFNSSQFGPTFGAGADLAICHNSDRQKTSYCEFPYSYQNPRYKQYSQHNISLFTGQSHGNHFLLRQWQVWQIVFMQ